MRIYIAAPWIMRGDMEPLALAFERAGHTITHRWWADDQPDPTPAYLEACALHDGHGVAQAERLVLLNTAKSEGKAVEQGLALGLGIPIIAVGQRGAISQNVFHYLAEYTWVDTVQQAIALCSTI